MQNPIRILQVVVNMNRGGAETLLMNIYRNIDRSLVQFDFLVQKNSGAYEKEILELGGVIYRIPYVTEVGHFRYKRILKDFFDKHLEYKIVHAHMDCMNGLVMEAAKKSGIPVRISHSHNTRSEGNTLARIYKSIISMKILHNSTGLLACSPQAAKWLFGKEAVKALIIRNGVDAQTFSFNESIKTSKRKELQIKEHTLVIGHVGRFCPQKNHVFIIDIFLNIYQKQPDSVLLLIGEGPKQLFIKDKAHRLGLEHSVIFLGVRSDVSDLMQAMDAIIFPSLHEGIPVALIEAQTAGLKCVISDAISKDVDIGAGLITYLSLKDNASIWAKEIIKPYLRKKDTQTYLAKAGYSINSTALELQYLYLRVLNS